MDTLFTNRLKEARAWANMTQKQVADKLSVVESCYASWEQGRTEPNVTSIRKLCLLFGVSADYLLSLED